MAQAKIKIPENYMLNLKNSDVLSLEHILKRESYMNGSGEYYTKSSESGETELE